ncbi:hypothetical protein BD779DRAFT_1804330 [Infundibulicybe gibba]|nr:hypothetical protein BD779DRAFT_1804330 [Infundibulicybe gibba]
MAFSNARNFQIDRCTFNDVQGDYNQHIQWDFNQQINIHGDQDIRSRRIPTYARLPIITQVCDARSRVVTLAHATRHSKPFLTGLRTRRRIASGCTALRERKLGQAYEECMKDGMLVSPQATWPSSEAIEQLVRKSSGHFIYASTVVKFVEEDYANPVERLEAVLRIPNGPTRPGTYAQSTAFQELDQLYLHILRKAGDPAQLKWILGAVMYFGDPNSILWPNTPQGSISNFEAIFSQCSGIRFLLGNLCSIVEVTKPSMIRFLHVSMNDFLLDPVRSREFHHDLGHFEAGLVYDTCDERDVDIEATAIALAR